MTIDESITGAWATIQTTILSDLLGLEQIARSQAIMCIFFGLAALISIPQAGNKHPSSVIANSW